MISVCIATHNGEKYIKEQLDSILCQLSPEDEVVISDDGSTDATLEIIEGYKDTRIKIFHFKQPSKTSLTHIYTSRNFENALKQAKGDYIFLSDQDDIWYSNKVESCLVYLSKYDLVVHNMELINENGKSLGRNLYIKEFKHQNIWMKGHTYYGCAIAFKAKYLKAILPFPQKMMVHDFWITYIIEKLGKTYYEMNPMMFYRYREDSVSHDVNNSLFFKIQYRFKTTCQVVLRLVMCYIKINYKNIS